MKNHLRNTTLLLIVVLILTSFWDLSAQEVDLKKYRVRFTFETEKTVDQSRILRIKYLAQNKKDRKERLPISQAVISYVNIGQDTTVVLGEAATNNEGIAELHLPKGTNYLYNEDGLIELQARFAGTKAMKRQKKSLEIKDLDISIELKEIDSVNTVILKAFELDSSGQKLPVDKLDLICSVKGLMGNMPIEKGTLKKGGYEFEMPDNIRGDQNGEFELIVKIEEHDDYGTVSQQAHSNWGIFDDIQKPERFKLWTQAAPIWMYVVLSFLLIGAWANFIYTMLKLRKISKLGKT